MKAFVCSEFGPLDIHKVEEVAEPELLDGQVHGGRNYRKSAISWLL